MIKRKSPFKGLKLDAYEKDILRSHERGEWKPVENMSAEMKRYAGYARHTLEKLRKDRRVNIRLTRMDLERMRRKAHEEGIPYQTLMASILHKYVTGLLVEKRV